MKSRVADKGTETHRVQIRGGKEKFDEMKTRVNIRERFRISQLTRNGALSSILSHVRVSQHELDARRGLNTETF